MRSLLVMAAGAALSLAGCEQVIGAAFSDAKRLAQDGGAARPGMGGGTGAASGTGASGGSAGTGGFDSTSAQDAAPPVCDPVHPPERADTPPAGDVIEFTVVIDSVDYGDRLGADGNPEHVNVGYDLDNACTSSRSPNCVFPSWLDIDLTDGTRGRDNGVAKLLMSQTDYFGDALITSDRLNENVDLGVNAPAGILRVRGFGGLAEDDHVEVDWFVAPPASAPDAGGAPIDTVSTWSVNAGTVVDASVANAADTVSLFRDDNAFVRQRTLVARFEAAWIPLLDVFFQVHDVVLTATPDRNPATGQWTLSNGLVTGWTEGGTLLHVIPQIAFQSFGVTLCTNDSANYPTIKQFVCSGIDLAPEGADESAPCSAISFGTRFTTTAATLGSIIAVPDPPRLCPPPVDPSNDTCETAPVNGDL